jgi:ABC-type transporter Mla subunit MlaD
MTDSTLLTVLIVFVAICALSLLGQFLALFGLYKKVKEIHQQTSPLIGKAEATLESAKLTLEDSRKQINELTQKTAKILDSTQAQLAKIDGVVSDASLRAMSQLEKVELVVGDTVDRVQGLIATTHDGLVRPLKELNALAAGVKSGFGFLFGGKKSSVANVTHDEEMFI